MSSLDLRDNVIDTTLGDRIRIIRGELLKLNQAEFARSLGFTRTATISDYEKNKRNPDIDTLRAMAFMSGVTVEWLLTGNGPMTREETVEQAAARDSGGVLYTGDFREVNVYDIGSIKGPGDFPGTEPVDVMVIPGKDFAVGQVAIRVKGEGMRPTVNDGATVGVDPDDRKIVSGCLYIVWLNYEGATVKRIFVYPDSIVLNPDNPAFPSTSIPTEHIGEDFIIGKVVWIYQRF